MKHHVNTDYTSKAIHRKYYPHIDGIRALAVLPVVVFHILSKFCPGGFAGVDVFFVISGYLITGGILRDLDKKRFAIRNFYYRRIRRIMPAYVGMIIGVFIVGCILYSATPLIYLCNGVTAGTTFVANLLFWRMGSDYFSPMLHSQALLHLWSLSVEEQFYLFIPILCAIIWKLRRRWIAPVLTLLAVLSLVGATYTVLHGKPSSAFYLLPYRAWELLVGSLLSMIPAVVPSSQDQTKEDKWHVLFAASGLLMVLVSYGVLSSTTPFPGMTAIPPVLGTAILVRYGQSGWVSRLLSWKPFVNIGKISYSLYLWHWPVTVFWRYATYEQLKTYDYLGMLLLSFVLAYLSWRFVELPVRTSSVWTMRRAFAFSTAAILLLVILGTSCIYYKDWPVLLHPRANQWAGEPSSLLAGGGIQGVIRRIDSMTGKRFGILHQIAVRRESLIKIEGGDSSAAMGGAGSPRIFLIGDSHAGALRYGLDVILNREQIAGYGVIRTGTLMFDMGLPEVKAALKKLDELPQASTVVLAQYWLGYFDDNWGHPVDVESAYAQLEEFATYISVKGISLYILGDVPNYKYPLNEIAARMEIIPPRKMEPEWRSLQQTEDEYNSMQYGINNRLEEICVKTGAKFVSLHKAFSENGHYIYFDHKNGTPIPLYRDPNHLSREGALRAAIYLMPRLFPESSPKGIPEVD